MRIFKRAQYVLTQLTQRKEEKIDRSKQQNITQAKKKKNYRNSHRDIFIYLALLFCSIFLGFSIFYIEQLSGKVKKMMVQHRQQQYRCILHASWDTQNLNTRKCKQKPFNAYITLTRIVVLPLISSTVWLGFCAGFFHKELSRTQQQHTKWCNDEKLIGWQWHI